MLISSEPSPIKKIQAFYSDDLSSNPAGCNVSVLYYEKMKINEKEAGVISAPYPNGLRYLWQWQASILAVDPGPWPPRYSFKSDFPLTINF